MATMPCPIFVINLDSSRQRMEAAARQLGVAGLGFERIPAVDGRQMAADEVARLCPGNGRWFYAPLSRGEVGCYLSHLRALRRLDECGADRCIVLEDDFELAAGFGQCVAELCALGARLPDAVKLHGSRGRGEVVATLPSGRALVRSSSPPICSVCTLWTLRGARKLVAASDCLRRPVDVQAKHWWEMDLEVLWVAPPPVSDSLPLTSASTIGSRKVRGLSSRLRQVDYRVRYAVARECHYARRHGIRPWLRSLLPVAKNRPGTP